MASACDSAPAGIRTATSAVFVSPDASVPKTISFSAKNGFVALSAAYTLCNAVAPRFLTLPRIRRDAPAAAGSESTAAISRARRGRLAKTTVLGSNRRRASSSRRRASDPPEPAFCRRRLLHHRGVPDGWVPPRGRVDRVRGQGRNRDRSHPRIRRRRPPSFCPGKPSRTRGIATRGGMESIPRDACWEEPLTDVGADRSLTPSDAA